ncbi:hypothetical protein BJX96DRAFT_187908 [Aspergillus floccosus]
MGDIANNNEKICYHFANRGSCRYNPCRFAHVRRNKNDIRGPAGRRSRRNDRRDKFSDFDELALWKQQGGDLGSIFAKARGLIQKDEGTLQDVVQCLSKEDGLKRIQQPIQRDFDSLSTSVKRDLFVHQMLPFMEAITDPNVLSSLMMEQAVATIYNCLYGVGGRRAEPFLRFLASAVQLEIDGGSNAASAYLEQSLLVFWKIVELNSTAFIQESLKPVARLFADLFLTSHDYLDKLQYRLDIGLSLPNTTKTSKQPLNQKAVAFVTQQTSPGGRHDNDHADICQIKIMPTFQEILSPRSEYLPVKDPRQNFRLLREDTLQPAEEKGNRSAKGQTRTHVYREVVFLSDALVCLVDPRGSATFCTVASPDRKSPRPDADEEQHERVVGSLSADPNVASVVLQMVEPSQSSWQYILDCHASQGKASPISLVEFPAALQRMQKAADVPMSEFLVPRDEQTSSMLADVPPPVYTAAQGFSFDLKCLMEAGSSLKVDSSGPVDLKILQQALVHSLQRKIGLIQGPPGTGKSYTGVALIKKGLGPIICVCYTNHALDQLLEDLLDHNITSQIIRIGSQSKSERLQPLNLRTVVREVEKTRLEKKEQWRLHEALDGHEARFRNLSLNSTGSPQSLKYYIERYQPVHYGQLFGKDEDGGGRQIRGPPRSVEELASVHVDMMSARERKALHAYWVEEHRKNSYLGVQAVLSAHVETKASWDRIRDEMDLRCLRAADVIGVTTTGLARNLKMLRRLPSKVLVCEEAGEVSEAHMLTSLLPSLEQVVLIGDHQQLRPQIQHYDLSRESKAGRQYSLDTSLFERLVEPDDGVGVQIPFCTLETQRRMHPSISQLIRDTLYPRLQDAPSVLGYSEVTGMRKRLFWLDHRAPEGNASNEEAMATSHWNDHEIQLTVALVNHLLRQGTYQSGDIAVLTPYLGQLHRIRRKLSESFIITVGERDQEDLDNAGFVDEPRLERPALSRSTLLHALRVATIDNFQDEEAKVVVISLVRSNSQNRCGFLRTPSRINVLLSRAKHGMYLIGNSATSRNVEMWGRVLDMLEREGNIGYTLDLTCPRHPEASITVSEPDHFAQYSPEGGCSLQCGKRLQCGHPCKQKCHSEMLHSVVYCPEQCQRLQQGCSHPCPKPCGDPCPKQCAVPIFDADRLLPCGHLMTHLPCWQAQDLSLVNCSTLVYREIPHCRHRASVACHVDVNSVNYQCTHQCGSVLSCGHNCKRECASCVTRTAEGPRIDHGKCTQKCGRLYSTCAHACTEECHGDDPCPPCPSPCDVRCGHSRCPKKCSEPCAPCAVSECLSACPHSSCSMPCAAPCDHIPCSVRCDKVLSCGHQCPSVCGEPCPSSEFCQHCASDSVKDTMVDFILGEQYREVDLTENPCIFPECGHFLTIESMDGQMGIKNHYVVDDKGRPISIASSSHPFSIDDIRTCAICRGSLRNVSRYGRLRFILYLNQEYVPMAQDLPKRISQLQDHRPRARAKDTARRVFQAGVKIRLEGPPDNQVQLMRIHISKHDKARWEEIIALREKIRDYSSSVEVNEQPFNRVHAMVEDARRRKRTAGQFDFDAATALLLRLDTALLADFLSLRKLVQPGTQLGELYVNLAEYREESQRLAEGNIFLAQFSRAESLLQEETAAIEETRGLREEIEGTRAMLRGSVFYTPVTNEERMAVLAAMSREFRGTGHWYYCENGHPFTIGECGGAMELSRCPECGAAVGGRDHRTATGVTHARDLETELRDLRL